MPQAPGGRSSIRLAANIDGTLTNLPMTAGKRGSNGFVMVRAGTGYSAKIVAS
jgi:hypothetical protein